MKYFVIGFNKTATKTFHQLFLSNGLKSYHGSQWDLDKYDCFCDYGTLQDYQKLHQLYPKAMFILNVRKINTWLLSRMSHGKRLFDTTHHTNYAYPMNNYKCKVWLRQKKEYHKQILNYFIKDRDRLIIVSINQDNWIDFIAKQLGFTNSKLIHTNQSPRLLDDEKQKYMQYIDEAIHICSSQPSSYLINDKYLRMFVNNLNQDNFKNKITTFS